MPNIFLMRNRLHAFILKSYLWTSVTGGKDNLKID